VFDKTFNGVNEAQYLQVAEPNSMNMEIKARPVTSVEDRILVATVHALSEEHWKIWDDILSIDGEEPNGNELMLINMACEKLPYVNSQFVILDGKIYYETDVPYEDISDFIYYTNAGDDVVISEYGLDNLVIIWHLDDKAYFVDPKDIGLIKRT